jgi:hypothetical protein
VAEESEKVTAYIAVEAGQRFSVKWCDLRTKKLQNDYEMSLYVDAVE